MVNPPLKTNDSQEGDMIFTIDERKVEHPQDDTKSQSSVRARVGPKQFEDLWSKRHLKFLHTARKSIP